MTAGMLVRWRIHVRYDCGMLVRWRIHVRYDCL